MKHVLFPALLALSLCAFAQSKPWLKTQMISPAGLASRIESGPGQKPFIINTGPADNIKGAIRTGPANTDTGVQELKSLVAKLEHDREIVIYCGCCSYSNCPNLEPAWLQLAEMGFTNVKVLYLSEGLGPDWTAKGFPMDK